jgi:hypothetical protein
LLKLTTPKWRKRLDWRIERWLKAHTIGWTAR